MSAIEGKLTLVTGSTKGIGKAIAAAFVDHGSRVVVHGRDRDEVKQLQESIGAFASVDGDLGTAAGCDNVIEQLAKDEGKPARELIDNYFAEHEPTSLIQRFIDVSEVAQAVVFLATNGAVNGSAQRVEGGIIRSI